MNRNIAGALIILIIGIIISVLMFEPVLKDPNAYLFSKGGDAVKSYFNFSYYLKYDDGMRHDGINYPYGDHLQYINSHPLYVNLLKFIDKNIVSISNYGTGILNLTMIFSLVLALPFLFLILRRFALPVWYSLIVSLIILYLTPQFDRIHGHFEMVYAFFIPLFWYLLLRYDESRKKLIWGILLVISGLIGGFTSAYYAAFYSIFLLSFLVVKLWVNRKRLNNYKYQAFMLFFVAILPIIVVKGLVSLTDWVDDRPENPWGFYIFHSNIWSIFLPNLSSLKHIFNDPHFLRFQWEGKAYVGFPATILAIIITVSMIYYLLTKQIFKLKTLFPNSRFNIFVVSAFLVLLFSMCFPFKYGLGFLKDWIPQLKQFRALGRFSWIFYYIFTVYTAYIVYIYSRRLRINGYKVLSIILLMLVLGYWSLDAGMNIRISTRNLLNTNDLLESSSEKYQKMIGDAGIYPEKYQAMIFLPFANTCGDKLLFTQGMNAFNEAMSFSYHTGVPLIQSFSPRLSFLHALSSIQMLADPAIRKIRLDDMNNKPILVLQTHEKLNQQEEWLSKNSAELFRNERFIISEIYPEVFNEAFLSWQRKAHESIKTMGYNSGSLHSDTLTDLIIHRDFEDLSKSHQVFNGKSAFYLKKGKMFLLDQEVFNELPGGNYLLSYWVFVDTRTDNMPEAKLYTWDKEGKLIHSQKLNNREEHNIYKYWVRIDEKIDLKEENNYALEIKGRYISVDELLIQPVGSNVYYESNKGISLFNNYPLQELNHYQGN